MRNPIMASPENRKKRKKPSQVVLPSLPDDLLVSCFARVSRFYYPTLALVSKSFRALIASPDLYEARSFLGQTESCLHVCLRSHPDPYSRCRWYTLCRKPHQKKKEKSSGYVLSSISNSISHSPHAHWSGMVSVGYNVYNIGNARVSTLDCRSNTWQKAPSMLVNRKYSKVSVVDEKIYVAGGCKECDSTNSVEVFDPKTQTWELVSSPLVEVCESSYVEKSAGIDGKMYIVGNNEGFVYEPKEDKWEKMGLEMDSGWVWHCCCVIEDVLYCYNINGEFKWYDTKVRVWRVLKGVVGLPNLPLDGVKLADYGGRMAVLWEVIVGSSGCNQKKIMCAVVEVLRCNSEVIWGAIQWYGEVLTVPKSYSLEYGLATTF